MILRILLLSLPALLLACGDATIKLDSSGADSASDSGVDTGADTSTDSASDSGQTDSGEACEPMEVNIVGPNPPHVGEYWDVLIYCDGVSYIGPTVLRFTPPELATVDHNHATFVQAGEGTMRIQIGGVRREEAVTVLP